MNVKFEYIITKVIKVLSNLGIMLDLEKEEKFCDCFIFAKF